MAYYALEQGVRDNAQAQLRASHIRAERSEAVNRSPGRCSDTLGSWRLDCDSSQHTKPCEREYTEAEARTDAERCDG